MISNFLGDVHVPRRATSILSAAELIEREGVNLQKGMNFRDKGEQLSVFLVLSRASGGFKDEWDAASERYTYEGHDSTAEARGATEDQLLMYGSDKVTENGRFYHAADDFKNGVRADALQVQVYEKLDPGVWFDKGIFNLIEASGVQEDGRKVYKFILQPADFGRSDRDEALHTERMLGAAAKTDAWAAAKGRCETCGSESGLRFVGAGNGIQLVCAKDRGDTSGWGLLG